MNKAAVALSIYGALVKAQEQGKTTHVGLMWSTLYELALGLHGAAQGGTNYVHPVIQVQRDGRPHQGGGSGLYGAGRGRDRDEAAFRHRAGDASGGVMIWIIASVPLWVLGGGLFALACLVST